MQDCTGVHSSDFLSANVQQWLAPAYKQLQICKRQEWAWLNMVTVPMPSSFGKTPMGDSVLHKIHVTFPIEKAVQTEKCHVKNKGVFSHHFLPCRGRQRERG